MAGNYDNNAADNAAISISFIGYLLVKHPLIIRISTLHDLRFLKLI